MPTVPADRLARSLFLNCFSTRVGRSLNGFHRATKALDHSPTNERNNCLPRSDPEPDRESCKLVQHLRSSAYEIHLLFCKPRTPRKTNLHSGLCILLCCLSAFLPLPLAARTR